LEDDEVRGGRGHEHLLTDKLADVLRCSLHFPDQLRPAIDDGHEILHVVMEKAALATAEDGFDLRCTKVRGVSNAYCPVGAFNYGGVLDGAGIPNIAEAQHSRVDWHQIDQDVPHRPAANRRSLVRALGEPERSEAF
jgi:hypothetical protein